MTLPPEKLTKLNDALVRKSTRARVRSRMKTDFERTKQRAKESTQPPAAGPDQLRAMALVLHAKQNEAGKRPAVKAY